MKKKNVLYAVLISAAVAAFSGCNDIDKPAVPVNGTVASENAADPAESDTASITEDETVSDTASEKPEPKNPDLAAFHDELEAIRKKNGVYGMGVALFRDGSVIFTDALGYADISTDAPVTNNTKFRAASVSKLISTIPVMMLVDRGKLDFDGDLSEQTGLNYKTDQSGEVKLQHLLSHTAGIVDTYNYEVLCLSQKFSTNYILETAHSGIKAGSAYNYSNFGAGTMGAIVECITGKYFHEYADMVMFTPLGMDAGYLIDYIEDKESCATIYDHDGEVFNVPTWGRKRTYYDSFGIGNSYLIAQCELLISANDLAKLGTALAGDGTVDGYRLLSQESISRMHTKYFQTDNFGMGLNVRIYDGNLIEGRTIYGHPGNALGAICGLYYDRSDHTGVAVLTNRSNLTTNSKNGVYNTIDDVVTAAYEAFF